MIETVTIRPVSSDDEQAWTRLWHAYCEFYETQVPPATTSATWRRILAADSEIEALIAVQGEQVVGFANYLLHPRTWSEQPACYLEDIFVTPASRGQGAGRQLIEHLQAMGRERGWSLLYWLTHEDNATARALYDRFVPADGFVRYSIPPDV